MAFYVGQKVVCVDAIDEGAAEPCCCFDFAYPETGDIATVVGLVLDDDDFLCLELREFPAPACAHCCAGWTSLEWRPLVERKTDISIFKKLLTPKGVDA